MTPTELAFGYGALSGILLGVSVGHWLRVVAYPEGPRVRAWIAWSAVVLYGLGAVVSAWLFLADLDLLVGPLVAIVGPFVGLTAVGIAVLARAPNVKIDRFQVVLATLQLVGMALAIALLVVR